MIALPIGFIFVLYLVVHRWAEQARKKDYERGATSESKA